MGGKYRTVYAKIDGQLYRLIRRSDIIVCRSHYRLSLGVCKEDKVGDKMNNVWVKLPSVRALSRSNERLKTNEEVNPREETTVESVKRSGTLRLFDNETYSLRRRKFRR